MYLQHTVVLIQLVLRIMFFMLMFPCRIPQVDFIWAFATKRALVSPRTCWKLGNITNKQQLQVINLHRRGYKQWHRRRQQVRGQKLAEQSSTYLESNLHGQKEETAVWARERFIDGVTQNMTPKGHDSSGVVSPFCQDWQWCFVLGIQLLYL